MPSRKGFPFAKTVTVLAVTFGVALGMCGLNYVLLMGFGMARGGAPRAAQYVAPVIGVLGFIELAVMILSGPALVITVIAWVISEAVGSPGVSEPQRLLGNSQPGTKNDESDRES